MESIVVPSVLALEDTLQMVAGDKANSSLISSSSVKIQPNGLRLVDSQGKVKNMLLTDDDADADDDKKSSNAVSLQILMPGKLSISHNSKKKCNTICLEPSDQKRYIPTINDPVVGIVTQKSIDFFKVDIGAAHVAILPALSFENATKRNKPNLQVGSLVYARIVSASKFTETVLACTNVQGKSDGFGELKDGTLINISSRLAHELIKGTSIVMKVLSETLKKSWTFELACGWNSRLWINCKTVRRTLLLSNVLQQADLCHGGEPEIQTMLQTYMSQFYSDVQGEEDENVPTTTTTATTKSSKKQEMELDDEEDEEMLIET